MFYGINSPFKISDVHLLQFRTEKSIHLTCFKRISALWLIINVVCYEILYYITQYSH